MPRKTEANDPGDWFWLAEADLEMVRAAVEREISFTSCRGKLAEVLEKILKGELIRIGWTLEKTHDLERLLDALVERKSDLTRPSSHSATVWPKSIFRTGIPVLIWKTLIGPI